MTGMTNPADIHCAGSGSAYIFRHKQIRHEHRKHLSARTDKVISRARRQWSYDAAANHLYDQAHGPGHAPNGGLHSPTTSVSTLDDSHMSSSPVASSLISPGGTPRRHVVAHSNNDIRDALHVARHDHMSDADCFVGVFPSIRAAFRLADSKVFCCGSGWRKSSGWQVFKRQLHRHSIRFYQQVGQRTQGSVHGGRLEPRRSTSVGWRVGDCESVGGWTVDGC